MHRRNFCKLAVVAAVSFALPRAATALEFDVVSIRQNNSTTPFSLAATPDGYKATNVPLVLLIVTAYKPAYGGDSAYFELNRIKGLPDWARSDRYDLDAKLNPSDLPSWKDRARQKKMTRLLLQSMLTDRCKLTTHRESKQLSVYNLVLAKNGPKFKKSSPLDNADQQRKHSGGIVLPDGGLLVSNPALHQMNFYGTSLATVAEMLSVPTGRTVIDKTGLTGQYDITVLTGDAGPLPIGPQTSPNSGPSIFTAVQDLGLKLIPSKQLVEILVIDHIERPAPN